MQAQINGIEMKWERTGKPGANVLLLIHGFPFNSTMWQPQLAAPPEGWEVIVPDLRGFGGSRPVGGDTLTMDMLAADLLALLSHLGIPRAVVCGLSMGGYVAFAMLRRRPDAVRALVLCDTRATADDEVTRRGRLQMAERVMREGTAPLVDSMLPKLISARTRRVNPDVERSVRQLMQQAQPDAVAAGLRGMAARPDSTDMLREINVPTHIIVGEEDEITPIGDARLMTRSIRGSQLSPILDTGHLPNLERPDEFNRVLAGFLANVF